MKSTPSATARTRLSSGNPVLRLPEAATALSLAKEFSERRIPIDVPLYSAEACAHLTVSPSSPHLHEQELTFASYVLNLQSLITRLLGYCTSQTRDGPSSRKA